MRFAYDDGGRAAAGFRGTTGDCAVRAAAIATGLPYAEVYREVNHLAEHEPTSRRRRSNARTGVWPKTLGRLLDQHGFEWVPTMTIGSGCRVHLREEELPSGVLVARVSKHFVAIVDGEIHDTHDPSREGDRCVYGYWQKRR